MITAPGEDPAYAMCGACPVPEEVKLSYCHKWKGQLGLQIGNLCLLREIERNQPSYHKDGRHGIRLTTPRSQPTQATRDRHHQPLIRGYVRQAILSRPVATQQDCEDMFGMLTKSLGTEVAVATQLFITVKVLVAVPVNSVPRVLDFFDPKQTLRRAVVGGKL